jgi:predicted O-methyltransferase YrrM
VAKHGLRIRGGPFAGMTYVEDAVGPHLLLVPMLLGAYERELHRVIAEVIDEQPETVVNVGSASGYYAVGLAFSLPAATVYAFERDPFLRALCAQMAEVNGVAERIRIGPACDVRRLLSLPQTEAFVLIDCEGCELEVLRPDLVPLLERSRVLVELHDFLDPATSSTISARFARTHHLRMIELEPRSRSDYRELRDLEPRDADLVIRELKPAGIRWGLLTPRNAPPR